MDLEKLIQEMMNYCNQKRLTQTDFARIMNVSVSTVSLWFSGKRGPCRNNYITFLKILKEEN